MDGICVTTAGISQCHSVPNSVAIVPNARALAAGIVLSRARLQLNMIQKQATERRIRFSELLIYPFPGIVRIVLGHGPCNSLSIGSEISLVDNSILIHHKGHDS